MTKPITPEMIAAWRTLQTYASSLHRYVNPTAEEKVIADAIDVLDNSDFMVPIEDAGTCGDQSAGLPEPPCDLDKPCPVHDATTPVSIYRLRPALFQALGADGRVWATATTRKKVEEHLDDLDENFSVLTHAEMAALKEPPVGLPTLAPGEEIRPAFSDTHPRAARELGDAIRGDKS